jgi:hypothetical protein
MTAALAYLAWTSIKNRILMSVRKLRNVRYLLSALFGLAYFAMMFSRNFQKAGRVRVMGVGSIGVDIMAGVIFVLFVAVWAWPSDDAGIAMSESEIQLLFSAPLRRRDILLYRFFRNQLALMISATMTSIFAAGTRNFIGMWFFFASLSLYMTMVQQLRAKLKQYRIGFVVRLVLVVAVIGGASWWAIRQGTFDTPLIRALIYIPRFFATAALGNIPLPVRLVSLVIVTVIGILSFLVAATVKVDFEEGSIALSQKRANAVTRQRSQQSGQWMAFKRLPPPFRLAGAGMPEIAIVWKNLIASLRIGMMPIVILTVVMLFLIGQSLFVPATATDFIGGMMLIMCAIVPLLGANVFSQDLRLDITRIEYLKTFPISGERLCAAEMAAPLIMMSIVELFFLSVTFIFLHTRGELGPIARHASPQNMLCVFIFTVPVCAVLTVMRNAAVLLFPSWIVRSKEEPRGFVVTGQRVIVMIGNLIVLAVVLIPAAIVFLPALFVAYRFFSGSPAFLAIASLPPVAIIAAEVWFGVRMLGKYFDGFDASNELDRIMT